MRTSTDCCGIHRLARAAHARAVVWLEDLRALQAERSYEIDNPSTTFEVLLSGHRVAATLVLAAVVGLSSTGALAPSMAVGSVSPLTDPAKIETLTADAYVWGVAPQFVWRFSNYNELVTAPRSRSAAILSALSSLASGGM